MFEREESVRMVLQWGIAYLVGSVPCGFIFGKLKGVDIRKQGSGNIGATNVWRVLGKYWGLMTFVLDFLKVPVGSMLALGIAESIFREIPQKPEDAELRAILLFLAAVLGHNFPVWLGFKGGKGIATSAGGLLWMMPKSLLIVGGVWVVSFAMWRYVGLASIIAAAVLPMATCFFYGLGKFFWFCCVLSVLAIVRHRSNIERLLQGSENRWERRQKSSGGSSSKINLI